MPVFMWWNSETDLCGARSDTLLVHPEVSNQGHERESPAGGKGQRLPEVKTDRDRGPGRLLLCNWHSVNWL